ncbi:hypothetical protein SELMODRAFT_429461 [Selaginella moellendorffii]|uniref:Uncharacterized protein n=1 Tax=Selaginella moellendorffii TaxID=88036 RepID=D8T697_SELML|nr:hypothetical protein SELMODRAFT_429461 [Selaginella moellendorffii]
MTHWDHAAPKKVNDEMQSIHSKKQKAARKLQKAWRDFVKQRPGSAKDCSGTVEHGQEKKTQQGICNANLWKFPYFLTKLRKMLEQKRLQLDTALNCEPIFAETYKVNGYRNSDRIVDCSRNSVWNMNKVYKYLSGCPTRTIQHWASSKADLHDVFLMDV